MKKSHNFAIAFLIFSAVLFLLNLAIIIVFSRIDMKSNFYNSINVASLSISFFSFISSCFFSVSVYLQTKAQNKINESLPKKDDQYITANYSLFNIEKEVSFFALEGDEKILFLKTKRTYMIEKNRQKTILLVLSFYRQVA